MNNENITKHELFLVTKELSAIEIKFLLLLLISSKPITQATISRILKSKPQYINRVANRLKEKGYIEINCIEERNIYYKHSLGMETFENLLAEADIEREKRREATRTQIAEKARIKKLKEKERQREIESLIFEKERSESDTKYVREQMKELEEIHKNTITEINERNQRKIDKVVEMVAAAVANEREKIFRELEATQEVAVLKKEQEEQIERENAIYIRPPKKSWITDED